MNSATLRLFNSVFVDNFKESHEIPQDILGRTIQNGYILDPRIRPDAKLLDEIEEIVGISGEKANAAFHKSWRVVQDTPMAVLVMQQIFHYITTYGFEFLGVYSEDTVYIPHEKLELPDIQEDIPLTVVKAMDKAALENAVLSLASSGIALSEQSLKDIMTIVESGIVELSDTDAIKNRELKAMCNDYYGVVPTEPVEFLRHLISKLTDETLVIKNEYLIGKIKEANGKFLDELLRDAPDDLASIFFRYKPLFLAMKSVSRNKTFFNRLRKQADALHKPLPVDYLNSITSQIKNKVLDIDTLEQKLQHATIWRKIRLAYALNYRLYAGDAIVYRVRNGRGWATEFEWPRGKKTITRSARDVVIGSIVDGIKDGVDGKTIYIPSNIDYALPASEKQFTGFIPSGSYVTVPEDMIVGIHWANTDMRVDLDLSVVGVSGKVGWDSAYRSGDLAVLFSGDMTDAPSPQGATELFYLKRGDQEPRIMFVNFYNFGDGAEVEAKIIVAHEKPANFGQNYMVDVGNIIAQSIVNVNKKQNILGLILGDKFYFYNTSVGNSITSRSAGPATLARTYLVDSLINSIGLQDILTKAGANVVDKRPDSDYVDLSPEALDKTTFLDLMNTKSVV